MISEYKGYHSIIMKQVQNHIKNDTNQRGYFSSLLHKIFNSVLLCLRLYYIFQMSEGAQEDKSFQDILRAKGIPLSNYKSDPPTASFFPNAKSFPDFFNENLVNDNRVIKQFLNDPHSNIRIFYYQLFRLGFQIETENNVGRQFITTFRRLVFYPQFEVLFTHQSENVRDVYNDFQFKRFFAQFFQLLASTPNVNIQKMVSTYPIIDQVMIHILRSILLNQGINQEFTSFIPTETVFGEFSAIIGLNVTSYGNCWKFEDSDMFCYEQNPMAIYLAYVLDHPFDGQNTRESQMVAVDYYSENAVESAFTHLAQSSSYRRDVTETYTPNSTFNKSPYQPTQPTYQPTQTYQPIQSTTTESIYVDPIYSPSNQMTSNTSSNLNSAPTHTTGTYNYYDNYSSISTTPITNTYDQTNYPLSSTYTSYNPVSALTNQTTSYTQYHSPTLTTQYKNTTNIVQQTTYGGNSNASQRTSNPAKQSMISQYYEFQDFTGETTIQKMKVPRSEAEREKLIAGGAPTVHFNKQEGLNNMKFGDLGAFAKQTVQTPAIASFSSPFVEPAIPKVSSNYQSSTYSNTVNKPVQYYSDYKDQGINSQPSQLQGGKSSTDLLLQQIKKYLNVTSFDQPLGTKTKTSSEQTYSYDPLKTTTDNYPKEKYDYYGGQQTTYTDNYKPSYETPYSPRAQNSTTQNNTKTQDNSPYRIQTTSQSNTINTSHPKSPTQAKTQQFGTTNYNTSYNTAYKDPYSNYSFDNPNSKETIANYGTSYSSFGSPSENTFYSNNPYVSSTTQQSYQLPSSLSKYQNPSSSNVLTDYSTKYPATTPKTQENYNIVGAERQTRLQASIPKQVQSYKIPLERTSASEYKPTYINQTMVYHQDQKPSSSYNKYNYQSPTNAQNNGIVYTTDYKKDFSTPTIYQKINREKTNFVPSTVIMPPKSPARVITGVVGPTTQRHSGAVIMGGHTPGTLGSIPAYTFNYRV